MYEEDKIEELKKEIDELEEKVNDLEDRLYDIEKLAKDITDLCGQKEFNMEEEIELTELEKKYIYGDYLYQCYKEDDLDFEEEYYYGL